MENLNIAEAEQLIAEKTALVVIDLQKGIVNSPLQAPRTGEQVVHNAAKLAQAFTEKGAFVVLVKVSSVDGKDMLKPKTDMERGAIQFSADWDQFVPEMTAHTPYHTVAKRQWGAFFGTDLDLQLRRRGINTIVLCGVSTSIGVDTTAREAYQHGYQQIFVEDAMTAATKEEHDYVCNTIFPRLGRIRSSEQVVMALK